jgi:hypothetical protein
MTHLLKTEWLKIKKYRAFWWMFGIVSLSYPGINYLFYNFYATRQDYKTVGELLKMLRHPFAFPDVWQTVAFLSSWFIFLPAVVVIMLITNEYTYKTHRQNIIDGWSRNQFMLAKMVDVLILSLVTTTLCFIVTLVIGYLNIDSASSDVFSDIKFIGLFFLQSFTQLSIAFLIAFLVRKAFIALGIFVFYFFPLEPLLVQLTRERANDIGRFLPLEISDRLIPYPRFINPDSKNWETLMKASNLHIFYSVILLILVWALCFRLNKKRDL